MSRKPPRPAHTYRAFKRNHFFGRTPRGNTKPDEKAMVSADYAAQKAAAGWSHRK